MVAMPNQQAVAAAQQGSTVYFERLPQGWVWASLSDRGRAVFLWHRFGSWWGRWPESSEMDTKVNTNHSHCNTKNTCWRARVANAVGCDTGCRFRRDSCGVRNGIWGGGMAIACRVADVRWANTAHAGGPWCGGGCAVTGRRSRTCGCVTTPSATGFAGAFDTDGYRLWGDVRCAEKPLCETRQQRAGTQAPLWLPSM